MQDWRFHKKSQKQPTSQVERDVHILEKPTSVNLRTNSNCAEVQAARPRWISSGELLYPFRESVAQGERVLAVGVLWFVFQSFRRLSCV